MGQQIAADIAGGQSERAHRPDHQMGEILADAAADFEQIVDGGRDIGGGAVIFEVGIDAVGQVPGAFENGPAGSE